MRYGNSAEILESAVAYAQRSWAVFPVRGKIPTTPNGFKDATNDPRKVEALFKSHPGDGIALATGKISGVFASDIDVKDGAGGDETLLDLEREHGEFPETVRQITKSKGMHYLFNYPDKGIQSRARVLEGIDIRGDGGYIVIAPSPGYSWEVGYGPDEIAIVDCPEWFLNLCLSPKKENDLTKDGKFTTGNRNVRLTSLAGTLRRAGLDPESLYLALSRLNQSKCHPPLDESEVRRIAQSIGQYKPGVPAGAYTDLWAARLFADRHGNNLHWCAPLGGWLIWDGARWCPDEMLRIETLARDVIGHIHEQANIAEDKKLRAFAIQRESDSKMRAMINLTRSEDGIPARSHEFDRDTHLINALDGTIDLKTGMKRDHDRADKITRQIGVKYNPEAKCPRWEKFMSEIFGGNSELVEYVQRAIGYSLCGDTREHCLFVLYGSGRNGKSTFLKRIAAIMGDYAANAPSSLLVERRFDSAGPSSDIARLRGVRLVTVLESNRSNSFDEAQVKALTGGDRVTACFKYQEPFEFDPTFKIFFSTNHKPEIVGTDEGIWRRIRTLPFNQTFEGEKADKDLDAKLAEEHEGIFNWMIEGYRKWQAVGLGNNPVVDAATQSYKEESDVLGNFIEERCIVAPGHAIGVTEFVAAFREWAKVIKCRHFKRPEINEYLEKKVGLKKVKSTDKANQVYVWHGIGLKGLEGKAREFESGLNSLGNERPY